MFCSPFEARIIMSIVELKKVKYSWPGSTQPVIDIEHFSITKGEKIFLKGPSGTGKSTLLGLIAGVNPPDCGELTVLNRPINQMSGSQRDHFRADHMGYIFQMFNLLPYLSVAENVCLPCHFSKRRKKKALEFAQGHAFSDLYDAVIGADIGGIPELIDVDRDGFIFEPGNARQLSEKIQWIWENRNKARKMGMYGRKKVEEKFNAKKHTSFKQKS